MSSSYGYGVKAYSVADWGDGACCLLAAPWVQGPTVR